MPTTEHLPATNLQSQRLSENAAFLPATNLQSASAASLKRHEATPEERRAAASAMGSSRTDAKTAAARLNGRKAPPGPGRTPRPLAAIACTCGRGDALEGHPTTCPRGLAIRRRTKAGTL